MTPKKKIELSEDFFSAAKGGTATGSSRKETTTEDEAMDIILGVGKSSQVGAGGRRSQARSAGRSRPRKSAVRRTPAQAKPAESSGGTSATPQEGLSLNSLMACPVDLTLMAVRNLASFWKAVLRSR